jgi:NAD(P)-dependent dehydrogenase (short-subunit alcohol dehydrogenase family)
LDTWVSVSYVVTGGGRGVGRSIATRLLEEGAAVIVIEKDPAATAWTNDHAAGLRIVAVHGNAAEETVAEHAAELALKAGTFAGWVNNAAVFRDAWLHAGGPAEVMALITANLAPVLAGCTAAVRRFLTAGTPSWQADGRDFPLPSQVTGLPGGGDAGEARVPAAAVRAER